MRVAQHFIVVFVLWKILWLAAAVTETDTKFPLCSCFMDLVGGDTNLSLYLEDFLVSFYRNTIRLLFHEFLTPQKLQRAKQTCSGFPGSPQNGWEDFLWSVSLSARFMLEPSKNLLHNCRLIRESVLGSFRSEISRTTFNNMWKAFAETLQTSLWCWISRRDWIVQMDFHMSGRTTQPGLFLLV